LLINYMEQTLTEWEVWYQLIPNQRESLSEEEFKYFLEDGPIFHEMTEKIMSSIREHVPSMELSDEEKELQQQTCLFDGDGNIVEKDKSSNIIQHPSSVDKVNEDNGKEKEK